MYRESILLAHDPHHILYQSDRNFHRPRILKTQRLTIRVICPCHVSASACGSPARGRCCPTAFVMSGQRSYQGQEEKHGSANCPFRRAWTVTADIPRGGARMRYEVTTGLTPREALEQATAYFGRGELGLQAVSQTPHSLAFQGGGGHVAITVKP